MDEVFVWVAYGEVSVYSLETIEDINNLYKELYDYANFCGLNSEPSLGKVFFDPDVYFSLFVSGDKEQILNKLKKETDELYYSDLDGYDFCSGFVKLKKVER